MSTPQFVPPRLVSIPDAARELNISANGLWHLVWSGNVPSVMLGRRRLIPRATIERLCSDPGALVVVATRKEQIRR